MAKILLVEDDQSLREIYSIRLTAEGHEIVSAGDGEEALAVAVKEKPELILADVMMPKISGFDMLDILRSTPETKDVKVIMMTALSSDDQRKRGEALGANRYLVKSQVGIEDVVNAVTEVLNGATPAADQAEEVAASEQAAPEEVGEIQPEMQAETPVAEPVPAEVAPTETAPEAVSAEVPAEPVAEVPAEAAPEAPVEPAPATTGIAGIPMFKSTPEGGNQ